MLKPEELSIGDWVKILDYHWDGSPYVGRVSGITKRHGICYLQFGSALSADIDRCEPISITPEILEKNGFKLKEKGVLYTEYVSGDEHSIIEFGFYKESIHDIDTVLNCELGFVGGLDRIHHCHVKYVHQLQNALRLCGITKEIEL